ncbi:MULTISPECIES: SDR family NAD(P)-dependent oxidoreductase [unclassified Acidisoma]|jgi:NAD(P)-dependent dehydrogenase (short-subunit alcohol dehydrogenase family)|uniref:SDR family NAD(P)-dependent oxidoreductase n=1 Tax=unclassified Acidisoma TaxID=2634065 RepID=UPI00131E5F3E|nr:MULTISPECIES: SDR family NAD(P)-dependent oxidoreductase [unclassified Acidisoma]
MSARVAILTGAAGGVGRAVAERFARDGWSLVLVDTADVVHQVAAEVDASAEGRVVGAVADITKAENLDPIENALREIGQPLKFLGLIAGVLQEVGPITTLDMNEWDRVMNVNLRANVLMIQRFVPPLKESGGGAIVTVSSWFGRSGHGLFAAYCASKAGLISLTQSAAAELADDNIRVNSVAPGNVATRMHFAALQEEADNRGVSFESMKKTEWDKIPLRRAAEPAEIAAAIAFLAGPDGAYLTGATIDVNGGVLFT